MRLLKCYVSNFDKASVRAAQYIPCLNATVDDPDRNPWLLNVENGTADLKTGEFLSHQFCYLILKNRKFFGSIVHNP
ncbi:MAG: hypothetical protein LBE17_04415 [Treponema sp.]|jgi:phage/plasmid-associated DNA primase|nr:hypothetical protein [Treponema sp.]